MKFKVFVSFYKQEIIEENSNIYLKINKYLSQLHTSNLNLRVRLQEFVVQYLYNNLNSDFFVCYGTIHK